MKEYDVFITPTLPAVLGPISETGDAGLLERLTRSIGMTYNTAPYDGTGYSALTLPVGFAPAKNNEKTKMPVGMQMGGRKFKDLTCLKVAATGKRRMIEEVVTTSYRMEPVI